MDAFYKICIKSFSKIRIVNLIDILKTLLSQMLPKRLNNFIELGFYSINLSFKCI